MKKSDDFELGGSIVTLRGSVSYSEEGNLGFIILQYRKDQMRQGTLVAQAVLSILSADRCALAETQDKVPVVTQAVDNTYFICAIHM